MINIVAFPNDTHFLVPLACVSVSLVAAEMLLYPLDRISSIMVARSQLNRVSAWSVMRQIVCVEGPQGLYRGALQTLDKNLSKTLIQYFCFNVLYNNFAYMHVFLQRRGAQSVDPHNPNLKHIDVNAMRTTLILQTTVMVSVVATQTKQILKLKIQCDALGEKQIKYVTLPNKTPRSKQNLLEVVSYHENMRTVLFRPGLVTRFVFENTRLATEIALFQYLLQSRHYIFQNVHRNTHDQNEGLMMPFTLAAATSAAVTTLCYPLKYMNQKSIVNALRNQSPLYPTYVVQLFSQNVRLLYRGFLPYLTKSVTKSAVQITLMWEMALHYKKKTLQEVL